MITALTTKITLIRLFVWILKLGAGIFFVNFFLSENSFGAKRVDKKWQESLSGAQSQLFTEDLEPAEGEFVGLSPKNYSIDAEIAKAKDRSDFTNVLDNLETRYRELMAYLDKAEYDYAIKRICEERHSVTASGSQVTSKAAKNSKKVWEKGPKKNMGAVRRKSDKVSSADINSKKDSTATSSVTLVSAGNGDSQTTQACIMQEQQHKLTFSASVLSSPPHLQQYSGDKYKKNRKSRQRSRGGPGKSHLAVTKRAEPELSPEYYALEKEFQNALGQPDFHKLLDAREQTYNDFKDLYGDVEYKAVIELIVQYRSLIESPERQLSSEAVDTTSKSTGRRKKHKKIVKDKGKDDKNKKEVKKKLEDHLREQEKIARDHQASLKRASKKAAEDHAQGAGISKSSGLETKNDPVMTSSAVLSLFASSELLLQRPPDTPLPPSGAIINIRDLEKKMAAASISSDVVYHESQQGEKTQEKKTKTVSRKKTRKMHKFVTKESIPVKAKESSFRHVPEKNKVLPASEEGKNQSDDTKLDIDNIVQTVEDTPLSDGGKELLLQDNIEKQIPEHNKQVEQEQEATSEAEHDALLSDNHDEQLLTTKDISRESKALEDDKVCRDKKNITPLYNKNLDQGLKQVLSQAKELIKEDDDAVAAGLFIFYLCDLFHLKSYKFWSKELSRQFVSDLNQFVTRVIKKSEQLKNDLAWVQKELIYMQTGDVDFYSSYQIRGGKVSKQSETHRWQEKRENIRGIFNKVKSSLGQKNILPEFSMEPLTIHLNVSDEWKLLFETQRTMFSENNYLFPKGAGVPIWIPVHSYLVFTCLGYEVKLSNWKGKGIINFLPAAESSAEVPSLTFIHNGQSIKNIGYDKPLIVKKGADTAESKGKWLALEGEKIFPLLFPGQIDYPDSHLEGQIREIPEGKLDRLLMQDRDKTSFQLLWKILQQLEAVIVIKKGGGKVLRILWSDKSLPLSGKHKQLVKDLKLASSLGNGIADLILALFYNANASSHDDNSQADMTFDTGINLMWYLKQAAIRGQVQALTLIWNHMGSNTDWQDATAFLTLSKVGFSAGAAPFYLPVELAVCPEKKLERLDIFSTLPDTWSADEDKRIADVFSTRALHGEEKFQSSVLKLLEKMAKRVREVQIDDDNRKLFIRRFGLLASIIRQLIFSGQLRRYSDITPLVMNIDKWDITYSYRSLGRHIESWDAVKKTHKALKKHADESANDEAQLISLLICDEVSDIQFKELLLSWIKRLHTSMEFITSSPSLKYLITRDVPEMDQLVIRRTMGVGTLNGPYAVILAKRLHEFRDVVLDAGATPEFIESWEKALLWRGIELGSADAAKFWFEWYKMNDEPSMAELAVQRYIKKLKDINHLTDNNWKLILKVISLYESLNKDDLKKEIHDVMKTLDLRGLGLGKLKELKLKTGLDVVVPDIANSLLSVINPDGTFHGNDQTAKVIEEALLCTSISSSQLAGYLKAVREYLPGHLERGEAESVLGMIFVSMAQCIPTIIKNNAELVFVPDSLLNKLLQKALEFGNAEAGLEIANLNTCKPAFISVPINVVEPDWLKNVLIPLAMSAEKHPLALKHLAVVLLSYPEMHHFSAVLSLFQALYKSEKHIQLTNGPYELLVPDQRGLLNVRVNQLVELVKEPLHDEGEDAHEYKQMITAQRLIETASPDQWEEKLKLADNIIRRNLKKDSLCIDVWEYLRSEVLIQIAVYKTTKNGKVNSGAEIKELEKYIDAGNENFNLIFLYFISNKKSLKAIDLLQMERYAYAAFSLKEEMLGDLGLLPVQLICLSSTFIYKGERLLLLASSYMTAAEKNSKFVENAEEKALYLLERAAQWGEGQAYRMLCDYWQQKDSQKYNEYVWRYMRFIYDQTHTSPNYDAWADKNSMLLRDSTFSEAHAYFAEKIAGQKK